MMRSLLFLLILVFCTLASRSSSSRSRSSSLDRRRSSSLDRRRSISRSRTSGCRRTITTRRITSTTGCNDIDYDTDCFSDTLIAYNPNGTVMYNGVELKTNDTSETIEQYATIQLVCDEGYSLKYGVSNSFECNDYAQYLCKPNCVIVQPDSTTNFSILAGTTRALTNGTELKQGETMQVDCSVEGTVIEGSKSDTTQVLTCGNSATLTVPTCRPTCNATELQDRITNVWNMHALLSSTDNVAAGQKVSTDRCQDSSDYIYTPIYRYRWATFYCVYNENNSTSTFTSNETSLLYQCFGNPKLTVTTIGTSKVNITVTVDPNNVARGLSMNYVKLERTLDTAVSWHSDARYKYKDVLKLNEYQLNHSSVWPQMLSPSTGYEYTDTTMAFGMSVFFELLTQYGPSVLYLGQFTATATATMPPQAVQSNITIIEYEGTTKVKVILSDYYTSPLSFDESILTSTYIGNFQQLEALPYRTTFTIELIVGGETVWIVNDVSMYSADVYTHNNYQYKMYQISVPENTLTLEETCTVKITSVAGDLTGGSTSIQSVVGQTTRAGATANIACLSLVVSCVMILLSL